MSPQPPLSPRPVPTHAATRCPARARRRLATLAPLLLATWALTGHNGALAALADIAQLPVGSSASVKPNIMFILDDSGSMQSEFMPDDMNNRSAYGYRSAQCNGLAYNPLFTYTPPLQADGTRYPDASFTAAPADGYNTSAGTVDLSAQDSTYYTYSGTQSALDWHYAANGNVDTSTLFYTECHTPNSGSGGAGVGRFTAVTLSATSPQAQNYANWYAYYRTRQLLMRTAVGRAFQSLGDDFRVGFTVISDPTVNSSLFLDVQDFNTSTRSSFYQMLYTAPSGGYTPLRGALSKVGRYFGQAFDGQSHDPVQYSCQRNFALLSTDGYWNSGGGRETGSYGPLRLDGSTPVGQQDGAEARPMRDSTGSTGGGDANSLADVAQYYWATDLRPDLTNNVVASSSDSATHQHLSTYTLGLGVQGTLEYDRNYLTQTSGAFADLKSGAAQWPVPSGTLGSGTDGDATHVDDLWHAAVNGRGQYFSALDPSALADALSATLTEIGRVSRAGAGGAASTLTPVSGNDWVFVPSYSNTPTWHGDLRAFKYTFDANGNAVAPDTGAGREIWSAAARLDARTSARRVLFNAGGSLQAFTHANLSAAGLSSPFEGRCTTATRLLSQCGSLSASALAKVTGANLVNFLAGDTSLALNASDSANRVFRTRSSRLGDLIGASPVYVGKPPFKYADAGYAAFVSANTRRTAVVYAAGNDGMLHAFKVGSGSGDTTGGEELWAFIPTGVLPELWRLADANYDNQHRYFVDGTPNVTDVWDGSRWRSLLVGGLSAGGRAYYALDVTDPLNPSLLWEFSDDQLGLSYSNPVVTKNAAGTWVVAFTSGVNNVNPGDGVGRLFIVNALTGQKVATLSTGSGSTATPSNLGRLNAWIEKDTDNTALRLYAGDMQGDLWRFDPDDRVPPSGAEAVRLGTARGPSGTVQPIYMKPLLSEIQTATGVKRAIVTWGTGRLLGHTDLTDTTVQSIYSIQDRLGDTGLGVLRNTSAALVAHTLNSARQIEALQPVDWTTQNGWYVDLTLSSGERVQLDGTPLAEGVLAFASTLPSADLCNGGGVSYLYQFDLHTGRVLNSPVQLPLLVGLSRIVGQNGQVSALMTTADQQTLLTASFESGSVASSVLRRSAWRELVD